MAETVFLFMCALWKFVTLISTHDPVIPLGHLSKGEEVKYTNMKVFDIQRCPSQCSFTKAEWEAWQECAAWDQVQQHVVLLRPQESQVLGDCAAKWHSSVAKDVHFRARLPMQNPDLPLSDHVTLGKLLTNWWHPSYHL